MIIDWVSFEAFDQVFLDAGRVSERRKTSCWRRFRLLRAAALHNGARKIRRWMEDLPGRLCPFLS